MPRTCEKPDEVFFDMFFVYILRTSKNTLYIGQTNDLEKRLKEHRSKSKKSSKYMRSFDSFTLVYTERYKTRSEAMKREYELKKLTKAKKETLVNFYRRGRPPGHPAKK